MTKAAVTITDLTRMQGERVCVAGYTERGQCVRLGFPTGGPTEAWLRLDAQRVIRPFSVVDLDLLWPTPEPPHTEDWVIDPECRALRGLLPASQQEALLKRLDDGSAESIFGAEIRQGPGFYVLAGQGERSLGTVRPGRLDEVHCFQRDGGRWDYRLGFTDQAGRRYDLAVVDLAFRCFLNCLRRKRGYSGEQAARRLTSVLSRARLYLRLGLARRWAKYPDRCYLQITGVYSFPDYLGGRCFADF